MARLSFERRGDQVFVEGGIDDGSNLLDVLAFEQKGRLVLDLAAISFINSPGVREWIRMQQAAEAANIRLELRRVAEPLVHQLNILPAARGGSIVSSFMAPYECEPCERKHDVVIDLRVHGTELARGQPPALPCPDCKSQMAFGHPPELYFAFLTDTPR